MASYSQELKDSIVTRLLTGETSASDLAIETGISINTIYRWRDKAKKPGMDVGHNVLKWTNKRKSLLLVLNIGFI